MCSHCAHASVPAVQEPEKGGGRGRAKLDAWKIRYVEDKAMEGEKESGHEEVNERNDEGSSGSSAVATEENATEEKDKEEGTEETTEVHMQEVTEEDQV